MMLLLTDEGGSSLTRKDDEFDDVFKFEDDMPFACETHSEQTFSKAHNEGDKRSPFTHSAHLAMPPVLQSFQNKDEEDLDVTSVIELASY